MKDACQRLEQEKAESRDRIDGLEQRVTELSELLNLELQKGYELDKEKQQMRLDHDYALQSLQRDLLLRSAEKERELLILKSEVIRAQESREDSSVSMKKLTVKHEKEVIEWQLQVKALTKINEELKGELEEVQLLESRLAEKDQVIESLEDDVDTLKEQVLAHRLRLVPREDMQSGSNSVDQETVKLAKENRLINNELTSLKRKLDDQNFKMQSK